MKTDTRISGITKREVSRHVYDTLARICPEGDKGRVFSHVFTEGDERLAQIQHFLEAEGFVPWNGESARKPNQYRLQRERRYEPADFSAVSLFKPWANAYLSEVMQANVNAPLTVELVTPEEAPDIAMVGIGALAVSSRLKATFERANLEHLVLRPCAVVEEGEAQCSETFLWEVTSDLVLPRLAPDSTLRDGLGGAYIEGKSHACIVYDGYLPPELHYRASDLKSIGPFDIARSREPIARKNGALIVSRKFYDLCQAQKLNMDWTPVRIDPE